MSSPHLYTYVSGDNVLNTINGEWDLSNSVSPAVTDPYNSNVIPNGNYVPWFIDTDNMEVSTRVEHEPMSALSTNFEDPQWDYQEVTRLPTGDAMYRHTTGNSEPWPNNFHNVPQQSFVNSPEDASYFTEGGEYSPSSSHLDSSQQQPLVMPAIITFKQEPQTPSEDIPPPPKRRKSYTGTSASTSSPTEDYRKGHNAIEKRYRSNLNAKILSLEQCLPPSETPGDDDEVGPARKTKSAILTRAVKHIEFLQQQTRRLTLETEELNRKFSALEKIAIRDSVVEVTEVEVDAEADGQEETRGKVREVLSPETNVETVILNSKLLARRRLRADPS